MIRVLTVSRYGGDEVVVDVNVEVNAGSQTTVDADLVEHLAKVLQLRGRVVHLACPDLPF